MNSVKTVLFNSMLVLIVLGSFEHTRAAEHVAESAKAFGSETMGEAIPYIGLACNAYEVGKDAKSYFCPSDEEIAHAAEIEDKIQRAILRKELKECLINNRRDTQRGTIGIPSVCEEIAEELSVCGGTADAISMINIFQAFNK